jgi:hypothetical protein
MAQSTFDGPVVSLNGFQSLGPSMTPTILAANTSLTVAAHAGKIVRAGAAAGIVLTLPAILAGTASAAAGPGSDPNALSNVGAVFTILTTTTITSNSFDVQCAGSDKMIGVAIVASTGTSGSFSSTNSSAVKVSMNGTTTGGVIGSMVVCTALSSALWYVQVFACGTGVAATPFA